MTQYLNEILTAKTRLSEEELDRASNIFVST
jgi:hypothetical protein